MAFYLYVLKSKINERFYIGTTADLDDRVKRHNEGRSKSTKSGRPWEVVYTEEFDNRPEALARERQLKKWKSRKRIEELINRNSVLLK
ncbi:MAG: GIY-YIG nuclease family protein [Candidatus Zixiibacteriota bacterium]|nr:MAG: GIY-YIG nuclease family protein [candidate division Zixibacteria bacterium]